MGLTLTRRYFGDWSPSTVTRSHHAIYRLADGGVTGTHAHTRTVYYPNAECYRRDPEVWDVDTGHNVQAESAGDGCADAGDV